MLDNIHPNNAHGECPTIAQLKALMLGDLTEMEFDRIEAHINGCAECQAEMDRIGDVPDPVSLAIKQALGAAIERFESRPEIGGAATEIAPGIIGDFRIIRELGRGGMGTVYEAEQISLGRRVALKILPFSSSHDPRQLARFEAESQAAAFLNHPNIIPVHSVGSDRGVHYYAMRFVDGSDLGRVIRSLFDGGSGIDATAITRLISGESQHDCDDVEIFVSGEEGNAIISESIDTEILANFSSGAIKSERDYVRWVAKLGVQAAEGLNAAHEQGIVHRDIKPSNLLLEKTGRLWVTDFGLARIQNNPSMTATGDLLGTLRYSSPEQALGKRGVVDHRSDIYSLGATLYELLTGAPLFVDSERTTLLANIAYVEPRSPRSLNKSIPTDLETIVLKAISKDAAERYSSAQHLADDLQRFCDHKPIQATRPSLWNRMVKWSLRNKPWAAAILTAVVAMVSLSIGLAMHNESLANLNDRLTITNADLKRALTIVEDKQKQADRLIYAADMQSAEKALQEGDPRQVLAILNDYIPDQQKTDLRGPEWYYLQQSANGNQTLLADYEKPAYTLDILDDGRWLATSGEDSLVHVFDLQTFSESFSFPTGQEQVRDVVFSPDGKTLATAGEDGTVQLWDWKVHRLIHEIEAHPDRVNNILFAPDGSRVLSCGYDDPTIRIWNASSGDALGRLDGHEQDILSISISPDGRNVASASRDWTVRLWDLESTKLRRILREDDATKPKLYSLSFSRDGRLLASGGQDDRIVINDVETGQLLYVGEHHDDVQSISFSPDNLHLASCDRGGIIRTWTLPQKIDDEAIPLAADQVFSAHDGRAYCVRFAPDGRHIASAGSEGAVKWWSVSQRSPWRSITGPGHYAHDIAFVPDTQLLVTAQRDTIYLTDIEDLKTTDIIAKSKTSLDGIAVSSKGKYLATGDFNGSLRLYDLKTRREVRRHEFGSGAIIGRLLFSPDDKILVGEWGGNASLLNTTSPKQYPDDGEIDIKGHHLAFSPDGSFLISALENDIVYWDVDNRKSIKTITKAHLDGIGDLAFSPDGRLIASGGGDRQVRLWDARTGKLRNTLTAHRANTDVLAFSPDGRTVVSGDLSGEMIAWQVSTGHKLIQLGQFPTGFREILFSPDGKSIVCRLTDSQTYVFKLQRGTSLQPLPLLDKTAPPESESVAISIDRASPKIMDGNRVLLRKAVTVTRQDRPHDTFEFRLLHNGNIELSERTQRTKFEWIDRSRGNQLRYPHPSELKDIVSFDVCGHAVTDRDSRLWITVITEDGKVWWSSCAFPFMAWEPFRQLWPARGLSSPVVRVACREVGWGQQVEVQVTTREGKQYRCHWDALSGWTSFQLISNDLLPLFFTRESAFNEFQLIATTVHVGIAGQVTGSTLLASAASPEDTSSTPGFTGRARLAAVNGDGAILYLGPEHAHQLPRGLNGPATQRIRFEWMDQIPTDLLNQKVGLILLNSIEPIHEEEARNRIAEIFANGEEVDWIPVSETD